MEPRIQYAKTEDGVSIAYWTLGEGPPLVLLPEGFCHTQLEWQIPEIRGWYERLAQTRQLIRYDSRGFGLSQREVADLPADWLRLDLEAVVGRLELERFALFAPVHAGPAAIMYTVEHQERVSHLVLWCAYARGTDLGRSSEVQATRAMIDKDWNTYAEAQARLVYGWSAGKEAQRFAALIRESATPEIVLMGLRVVSEADVTGLLSEVRSPTLVLHRRQTSFLSVDVARSLASRIPQAILAVLEGASGMPFLGDTQAVLDAISDFLDEAGEEAAAPATGGFATILFTDMESSTALTERLGDAKAQEVRRTHNDIVRSALAANGGSEIKHTGDGIMASFATASSALDCAIGIQRGVAAHREEHPDSPLGVYVGLNAGEPIAEDDPDGRVDLFGTSVNLAKRICDHAEPGQIVAADVVRQLAAGKQFLFADLGETELRGFEDPVKLWELRWQAEGSP
ncbi:MAG: adenylate/guanylate cyclase domain-containing protein [Chloroflexi bacterium]|nr:adenylate/guanylate cyclase domain-containing protein [Chloroflexota bacterium]